MNAIERKMRRLKFWRMKSSSKLDAGTATEVDTLYRLHLIAGGIILGIDYSFVNSRQAFRMMRKELEEILPTVSQEKNDETHIIIVMMMEILDTLIA